MKNPDRRALAVVDFVEGASEWDEQEVVRNRLACLLNCAAAQLALQQPGEAAACCTRALQQDPSNAKALARRARAYALLHDLSAAEADVSALEALDPGHEALPALRRCLKEQRAKGEAADRRTYRNMFASQRQ